MNPKYLLYLPGAAFHGKASGNWQVPRFCIHSFEEGIWLATKQLCDSEHQFQMQIQGDNRDNVRQCCIKVKVNIFRANLFLSFLSCEDQTVFYAIYNLSSLVFFDPFNDGWHEQDLNKEWNPNVSRGGVSLKFRFRAVSYLSWLGSGWLFWDPKSKTFGTQKNWEFLFPKCGISQKVEVVRPKCALDFILVPRSRGYTWSSLHKWQ